MSEETTLADDLLKGANAIAEFMGMSERQAYHLLETGALPCFKIGKRWHGRRSTLLNHIKNLERGETK